MGKHRVYRAVTSAELEQYTREGWRLGKRFDEGYHVAQWTTTSGNSPGVLSIAPSYSYPNGPFSLTKFLIWIEVELHPLVTRKALLEQEIAALEMKLGALKTAANLAGAPPSA